MKKKNQFQKDANKLYSWMSKARKSAIEYLNRVLNELPDKRIELDTENDEFVTIVYDGGNHPEYAGNICSTVYSVFIHPKHGLCVEIEENDEYEADRIDTCDLLEIADRICQYAIPRLKAEE